MGIPISLTLDFDASKPHRFSLHREIFFMKEPQKKKLLLGKAAAAAGSLADKSRYSDGAKLKKPNTKSKKMGDTSKSKGFLDFFGF